MKLCHSERSEEPSSGERDPSQGLGITATGRYFTLTKRSGKLLSAGWTSSMFLRAAHTRAC
jgi:hypothetical protein